MSKRELTGMPVADDIHQAVVDLIKYPASVIQHTNKESLGGSQIWFEFSGQPYKISVEKCTGPLKDLSAG